MKSFDFSINTSDGRTKSLIYFFLSLVSLLFVTEIQAEPVIRITDDHPSVNLSPYLMEHVDSNGITSLANIAKADFRSLEGKTPNYNPGIKSVWLKFKVVNESSSPIYLNVNFSNFGQLTIYRKNEQGFSVITRAGNELPLQ